ncbi:hypothetical protein F4776DRAFT_669194 [Hypoxylon sp. NC0597]|nr:hypothetical protein F4776DRAFT_669194 [Hypoxylon sp. NC0597]
MDSREMSAREREIQTEAKPSKYFPVDGVLHTPLMDNNSLELFARLAEHRVKEQAHRGIPIIRLWLDAHDAEDKGNTTDPYQQYLKVVRKTAGRLLAEELELSAPAKQPPDVTAKGGEASTPAQTPKAMAPKLGKLNPQAKPFSPSTPASKQTPRPDETKPAEYGLASFKEHCKRLGLRVSSANNE